jgi:beta-phosphoglucomutase-like phosphatase (HAD superfamily)
VFTAIEGPGVEYRLILSKLKSNPRPELILLLVLLFAIVQPGWSSESRNRPLTQPFQHFGLGKWFAMDRIAYNDGKTKGKPSPDLFLKAMEILGTPPEATVIFEDSEAGLKAAESAGAGKIVIVNSNGGDYQHWPHQVIADFHEVDRGWFG